MALGCENTDVYKDYKIIFKCQGTYTIKSLVEYFSIFTYVLSLCTFAGFIFVYKHSIPQECSLIATKLMKVTSHDGTDVFSFNEIAFLP